MPARLHIEGAEDMDRRLVGIGKDASDPAMVLPILMEALEPVAERAREIVPVRSGRLQNDIGVSDRAIDADAERGVAAYVGPDADAFYAEDVEFGRPASVSRSGRHWDEVPPNPFMRPAWDMESDSIIERVADGLGRVIERAGRK